MRLLSLSIHSLWFANLFKVPIYVISIKKSMIAHAAFAPKDTFSPRSTSIQSILDSVDLFGKLRGNSG